MPRNRSAVLIGVVLVRPVAYARERLACESAAINFASEFFPGIDSSYAWARLVSLNAGFAVLGPWGVRFEIALVGELFGATVGGG